MSSAAGVIRVLGSIDALDHDGQVIEIPGLRSQKLLALLAVRAGTAVAPDALIDALWPDALPRDPTAALQTLIYRLRRRLAFLGGPTITTHPAGYQLELGDMVDLVDDALHVVGMVHRR